MQNESGFPYQCRSRDLLNVVIRDDVVATVTPTKTVLNGDGDDT